jgi:hypothetical protein
MLTIPKVIAGLFFAALGFFVADLIKPLLPEGTRASLLNETLAIIGFVSGWIMAGAKAGDGTRAGLGYGLTSSGLLVFLGLFAFSGYEALDRSMNRRYDGPMEAIMGMIGLGMEYAVLIATPSIVGTMIVGGLFGGWLTEWSAKRWT